MGIDDTVKYAPVKQKSQNMGGEEHRFVQEAFKSNYIAPLGPMVEAFKHEFSEKVGIPYAVAVSSGTAAMPWWNSFTFHSVNILRSGRWE